ncbi:MAG TPA: O-antigen ligase family protein, partial [Planctomycetota bacterium]|nr:O-antigen ligase family protein [Planctomycetota bacterium]
MRWLGLGLIAAEVVVVGLAFDPGAQPAFALPKSAASRALSYALALAVGLFLFRHPIARPAGPAWAALAAFLGLSAVATAVGLHPYTALFGSPDRLLGLSALLEGALLALAVAVMVRGQRDALLIARALEVTVALIVLYALVQAAGRDPLRWAEGTLASTLGNTTVLGGYLATAASLLAATLAGTWRGLGRAERVALAVVAVLAAFIVVDRGGRAATLGLLAGLACVSLVVLRRIGARPRLRRRALLALGAAAGLSVAVAAVAAGPGAMERLERLVRPTDSSTTERVQIYRAALEAIAQHPLFGVGPDSFIAVYPSVRPLEVAAVSGPAQAQSSTHSWLLHHAVGSGLPGAAAIVAAALLALWRAWRAAPGRLAPTLGFVGLAAFLAHGLVSVSHLGTESLFWLSLGRALAPRVELAVHPLPGEGGRKLGRSAGSLDRGAGGERIVAAVILATGVVLAATTWA